MSMIHKKYKKYFLVLVTLITYLLTNKYIVIFYFKITFCKYSLFTISPVTSSNS